MELKVKKYGKLISIRKLKKSNSSEIVQHLNEFISKLDLEVGKSQLKSWEKCIKYLKETFEGTNRFDHLMLAFEYCIPLSSFRRPDVIMFFKSTILVLEFKRKSSSLDVDKHQLRGYLNELRNYHEFTHSAKEPLKVVGCLVVTEAKERIYTENNIDIVEGNNLKDYLDKYSVAGMEKSDILKWLDSQYLPLLNIMQATTSIFTEGNIPLIKNIEEGELRITKNFLYNIIKNNTNKKKIYFLTGVPGSGKTLILLHLLYHLNYKNMKALYTSGNGPLISTLSYILSENKERLDGAAYIKGIKNIKDDSFDKKNNRVKAGLYTYPTICFDEAQRAWDLKHMKKYSFSVSEPELLLRLQNRAFNDFGHANLVCSYGEGQSIYLGEESGFDVWSQVLNRQKYSDWIVYCPKNLSDYFDGRANVHVIDDLSIDTSIRSDFINIVSFIDAVLKVDFAKKIVDDIVGRGFDIKISRDFGTIKAYLKDYENVCGDKFYGMITSSNSSISTFQSMIPGFNKILTQKDNERIGKWYIEDCNKLEEAAAEFGCQGLELNIPIILFGRDFIIKGGEWIINDKLLQKAKEDKRYKKVQEYREPLEILHNIYRVLLSRGRKGMILFLPDSKDLHETYKYFKDIGIRDIN